MKAQTRQLAQDMAKRRIIDVAQGAGRLQTPMTQLLGTLDTYGVLPPTVDALEVFGMHGLWDTRDYVGRCSSLEFYEFRPTPRTRPNTEVIVADSIEAVKTGALRRDRYDLILSDNPSRSPFGKGYVEHFDLFPDLLRYIDDGVLVLSVLPPGTDLAPEHARRRQEFYGEGRPLRRRGRGRLPGAPRRGRPALSRVPLHLPQRRPGIPGLRLQEVTGAVGSASSARSLRSKAPGRRALEVRQRHRAQHAARGGRRAIGARFSPDGYTM